MSEDKFRLHIAQHLKKMRTNRGLSLDATAKLTGVSKAMLGQIERQESSPTISKLWQISSGLNTSFSAFFAQEAEMLLSGNTFPNDKNMHVKTIFPYQSDTKLEVFEIELNQYHQQMSDRHAVGVIEHICVLKGELDLYFDATWQHLKCGESCRFHADQIHGYRARSESVVFQNIVCYG